MHRNRTWLLDPIELRTQRNRILPIEGGDGSTLSLDFTTGVLDPRLTFTRSSTATYINSSGYVTSIGAAPTNDPTKARFDYDPTTLAPRGLLIEGSAANLLFWSESFATSGAASNWAYNSNTGAVVTTDNPAGGTTAFQFAETVNSGPLQQSVTVTNAVHTFSAWFKGSTYNSVTTTQVQFGLFTTGFVAGSASIISGPGSTSIAGNIVTLSGLSTTQWTRVQFTTSAAISGGAVAILIYPQSTAFEVNRSFYIWGSQIELGSGASSYIPTGASQGSRAADHCTMPTSSFITGPLYPHTLFVECIPATPSAAFPDIVRLFDRTAGGTFNYGNEIYYFSAATMSVQRKINSSSGTDRALASGLTYNTRHKFATAIDSSSFLGSYDGLTGSGTTTAAAALASQVTHLGVGCNGDASPLAVMFGTVRQIKFFPFAMAQSQLNALTTL